MIKKVESKEFDCVAFKNAAQARIRKEVEGLSYAEEIEYYRKAASTGPLGETWKRLFSNGTSTRE